MPEVVRKESVKTVTGVTKVRIQFYIDQFQAAGAFAVEVYEDPVGSGEYTVSATFIE
ncbi:MAG: hypothetical protein AABZ47_02065 [Planctomycetota bacterium]